MTATNCIALFWLVLAVSSFMLYCLGSTPGIGGGPCPCAARLVCKGGSCDCTPGYQMFGGAASAQFVNACLIPAGRPCEPNLVKEIKHDFFFDPDLLEAEIGRLCGLAGYEVLKDPDVYYDNVEYSVEEQESIHAANMLNRMKRYMIGKSPTDFSCISGKCTSGICDDSKYEVNPIFRQIPYRRESLCPSYIPTTERNSANSTPGFLGIFLFTTFHLLISIFQP